MGKSDIRDLIHGIEMQLVAEEEVIKQMIREGRSEELKSELMKVANKTNELLMSFYNMERVEYGDTNIKRATSFIDYSNKFLRINKEFDKMSDDDFSGYVSFTAQYMQMKEFLNILEWLVKKKWSSCDANDMIADFFFDPMALFVSRYEMTERNLGLNEEIAILHADVLKYVIKQVVVHELSLLLMEMCIKRYNESSIESTFEHGRMSLASFMILCDRLGIDRGFLELEKNVNGFIRDNNEYKEVFDKFRQLVPATNELLSDYLKEVKVNKKM